jgi:hypothetical protein
MWTLLLTSLILATAPELEVRALGKEPIVGTLVQLDDQSLAIETAQGRKTMPLAELMSLAPKTPAQPAGDKAAAWVELVDGSMLVGRGYTAAGDRARLTRAEGVLDIPTRDIKHVRLQEETDTAAEWKRIVQTNIQSDLLVVRQNDAINYHQGAIHDVTDANVAFTLDGNALPIKRAKVFGLIYYHPAGRELPTAIASLTDVMGSRWSIRSLRLDGDKLQATTPSGVTVALSLVSLVRVDFSEGKVVYLGDIEPETSQWTPYFGAADAPAARAKLFGPRHDRESDAQPLRLGGKEYRKGLALHSRTLLEYRLPSEFRRFQFVAGIDDRVRPGGNARLVIRGDDRVLLEATLAGTDPPRPVDLDLTGVRRLAILVDFGENLDVADHVDLGEARLVK